MKIHRELPAWRTFRRSLADREIGFVPTMGGLHEGHRALVKSSVGDNDLTVVSLFLNPTQFDQAGDLAAYPADLEEDLDRLRSWGVDHALVPDRGAMYPDAYRYRVREESLSRTLCGEHRPGHFDGVLTVVMRLLNLVSPRRVYFGEKDWQQLRLVRGMVEAFFLDTEVVACPTVRHGDGLALSSRNARLNPEQRRLAPALHRQLAGSPDAETAARRLERLGFDVDYVEDLDGRRLAAARLGEVRLIDNIDLEERHAP